MQQIKSLRYIVVSLKVYMRINRLSYTLNFRFFFINLLIPWERIEPGTRMDPANELATARLSANDDSEDYATQTPVR